MSNKASQDVSSSISNVLSSNPGLGTVEIAAVLGLDRKLVKATLLSMLDKGVIERTGMTKGTRYYPKGQATSDSLPPEPEVTFEAPAVAVQPALATTTLWELVHADGDVSKVIAPDLMEAARVGWWLTLTGVSKSAILSINRVGPVHFNQSV